MVYNRRSLIGFHSSREFLCRIGIIIWTPSPWWSSFLQDHRCTVTIYTSYLSFACTKSFCISKKIKSVKMQFLKGLWHFSVLFSVLYSSNQWQWVYLRWQVSCQDGSVLAVLVSSRHRNFSYLISLFNVHFFVWLSLVSISVTVSVLQYLIVNSLPNLLVTWRTGGSHLFWSLSFDPGRS